MARDRATYILNQRSLLPSSNTINAWPATPGAVERAVVRTTGRVSLKLPCMAEQALRELQQSILVGQWSIQNALSVNMSTARSAMTSDMLARRRGFLQREIPDFVPSSNVRQMIVVMPTPWTSSRPSRLPNMASERLLIAYLERVLHSQKHTAEIGISTGDLIAERRCVSSHLSWKTCCV